MAEEMSAERAADFEVFLKGVELVYAKLEEIALKAEGLERIEAEDKAFDPEQARGAHADGRWRRRAGRGRRPAGRGTG